MISLLLERWRPTPRHSFLLILAAAFMAATSALGLAVYTAAQPPACEVRHG